MSCRVDSTLIAGVCVVGNRGLGVLGSVVRANTATGTHGAGYLYNDWQAGDDAKEFRGLIVTPPAAGTFAAEEDGSFSLTGVPDGAYSFVYRLYVDGADLGTATASITIGAVSTVTASVAATGGVALTVGGTAAITADVSDPAPGAVTATVTATGGVALTVGGTVALTASVADVVVAAEPVTLAEAKLAARLTDFDAALDPMVQGLITAAREQAEHITGRLYHDAVERVDLTDWPASTDRLYVNSPRAVAIEYWDGAAFAALDAAAFAWADDGYGTVIAPAIGSSWPTLGERAVGERVRVTITGGLANPAQAPEGVKLYIKALVSVWINNPDAAQRGVMQTNPLFDRLLDRERLWH